MILIYSNTSHTQTLPLSFHYSNKFTVCYTWKHIDYPENVCLMFA